MATPAHCVNCSSSEHSITQCPLRLPLHGSNGALAGGFGRTSTDIPPNGNSSTLLSPTGLSPGEHRSNCSSSHPNEQQQQQFGLVQRTFQYPSAPQIPSFHTYPSPEQLNDDLFKWGQIMEVWAKGFQSFSIQLSEVLELNADPSFKIDSNGFSVSIWMPPQSQMVLDSAINRANQIINQSIPSYDLSTSTPINFQMLYEDIHQFPQDLMSPSASSSTVGVIREALRTNDDSPTPQEKGRGAGANSRGRGASSVKDKIVNPLKKVAAKATPTSKKPTTTPKKAAAPKKRAATPRRRAPAKKKAPKGEPTAADEDADGEIGDAIGGGEGLAVKSHSEITTSEVVELGNTAHRDEEAQQNFQLQKAELLIKPIKVAYTDEKIERIGDVELTADNIEETFAAQLREA